jgi:hypothetical protein
VVPSALRESQHVLLPQPRTLRVLVAAALVATSLSVIAFAVLSATGDRAIVADIGPAGPFADLNHTMPVSLVKLGCWFAAISGGVGVLAGLAAIRYGWRPPVGHVLAACAVATVVLVFVPPAASVDVQNYAEYGRIVVLGHNPYVMTPQQLFRLGDPVGLLRPVPWRDQPTVYGPAATAEEAVAAWLGGASMAWITFWIKVVNGACYVAIAVLLGRLAGGDPARLARVAVLWAVNPLMLFWMVAGAHADLLAVLPVVLALWVLRVVWRRQAARRLAWPAAVAGALAGIAIAVKVTFGAPVAGLAAALWRGSSGQRRMTLLASGVAGGVVVLAAGYLIVGRAALTSLSQRLSSANDSFLPMPGAVFDHAALYTAVSLAALLLVGGLLAWRMPPGYGDLPEIKPILVCALAVVLGGMVQYPWYDAMFFPLLALLPASRLDTWLTARIVLISCVLLPGVGIRGDQYRDVRIVVPAFMIAFLLALAAGKVFTSSGQPRAAVPGTPPTGKLGT